MFEEIERKFLIKGDFQPFVIHSEWIRQGYLSSVPERTVRIRIKGEQSFLTIKGKSNSSGLSRFEWEKEIPVEEGLNLLSLCEPCIIEKKRHIIPSGQLKFEIDEFFGDNQGLLLAEIELPSEDTFFEKPAWLGQEVTGDIRFYNAYLSQHPFKNW